MYKYRAESTRKRGPTQAAAPTKAAECSTRVQILPHYNICALIPAHYHFLNSRPHRWVWEGMEARASVLALQTGNGFPRTSAGRKTNHPPKTSLIYPTRVCVMSGYLLQWNESNQRNRSIAFQSVKLPHQHKQSIPRFYASFR